MRRFSQSALRAAAAIAVMSVGAATASDWPVRPVTMVVPFAAGGPTDLLARLFAQRMGEILGQPVVPENVGGAGGMTGADRVAKAAPDGYMFLLGTVGTQAQNQTVYKRPVYDSTRDFASVALVIEAPLVLTVRKDLPVSNMKEFVAYTKVNHDKMQFGSAGTGSAIHLGCALLNSIAGLKVMHIPYRGGAPAMQDLVSGRIDYLCDNVSASKPHIDGDSVKAIAMLTNERSPVLPDVPTAREQGFEVEAYSWNAFFLPRGTPGAIVQKLHDAAVAAAKTPALRERLEGLGLKMVGDNRNSPEYLDGFVRSEIVKWAAPIKSNGISVD